LEGTLDSCVIDPVMGHQAETPFSGGPHFDPVIQESLDHLLRIELNAVIQLDKYHVRRRVNPFYNQARNLGQTMR
jgi:hypothetical protein